jgi:hypothetical protein
MMGGGTFILLKAGRPWPESAKQAEIRLAFLLKMLQIAHFGTAALGSGRKGHPMVAINAIPLDMANHCSLCYRVHSFNPAIGAVLCRQKRGKGLYKYSCLIL